MTLEILVERVNEAISTASDYAANCQKLIENGDLAAAIEYCKNERIDPPQCSLTAQSESANKLRATASRKLSDSKWWEKVLEQKAIRSYEAEQMAQGNVRNYISDGLAAYTKMKKVRN